jgi:phage tail sheath protein FI
MIGHQQNIPSDLHLAHFAGHLHIATSTYQKGAPIDQSKKHKIQEAQHDRRGTSSRIVLAGSTKQWAGVPLPPASLVCMTNTNVQQAPAAERKPRKSVAFSDGNTIMDENGEVSEAARGGDRTTAEKHTNGEYRGDVCRFLIGR